jgi:hypothetical protein
MVITVINRTPTTQNGSETIKALTGSTQLDVVAATATIFWCGTAGSWKTK